MTPRLNTGKGVSGAVRYVLGEGRHPKTGALKDAAPDGQSRVDWLSGVNFGFEIRNAADADLARRIMEFDALNTTSKTRRCRDDCVHLTLSWRPGETPTREQMEEAARGALKDLGMENAKALFVAHNDEDYAHVHIVASKINPDTGKAYDLKASWRTLSKWAENYERDHGGIVCLRRADNNALRNAIRDRDAEAVLELMTKQRSTFTAKQLETALAKEIKEPLQRAQFGNEVLDHSSVVRLSDHAGGPTTRYSTRTVIEAEQHVLRAAAALERDTSHGVDRGTADRVGSREKFAGMTDEQRRAYHHVIGAEGIALIDGQAGTGKSYTLAAVREAYEASGRNVIGLAPTNAVARDMKKDGFSHAATLHSELFALNSGRRTWDSNTVVIVDEAAMLDTKLMAILTSHAEQARAKLILVGDDRQLSSIDRGGMFGALKDHFGCAALSEVKRQYKNDEKRASEMMAEGNFHDALGIYDQKGAINWTRTQEEAREALVEQWAKDSAERPDKSRFVFAYTNDDVDELNRELRAVRKERGELEWEDHALATKHGVALFSSGDRVQFTGTDKKLGIANGNVGTIQSIDGDDVTVRLDGKNGDIITFSAEEFHDFRHGYAGTIYKGQGRTLDETYLYHSEHWRSASSYVALTRHRDKTELFVATNTLNPAHARGETWMMEKGGAEGLTQEAYESAQRSYEKWKDNNPEVAARHGFADYVQYVQEKWTDKEPQPDNDRDANIKALARQMGRVDDRRAASQFHAEEEFEPVRPMTPIEIMARFGDLSIKRDGDENRAAEIRLAEDVNLTKRDSDSADQESEGGSDEQAGIDNAFGGVEMTEGREAQYSRASAGASRSGGRGSGGGGGRSRTR